MCSMGDPNGIKDRKWPWSLDGFVTIKVRNELRGSAESKRELRPPVEADGNRQTFFFHKEKRCFMS